MQCTRENEEVKGVLVYFGSDVVSTEDGSGYIHK
jgi:hypothetical protein